MDKEITRRVTPPTADDEQRARADDKRLISIETVAGTENVKWLEEIGRAHV